MVALIRTLSFRAAEARNESLEEILQPRLHALRETIDSRRAEGESLATDACAAERKTMRRILRKARHGCKSGSFYRIGQSTDVLRRHSDTHARSEHIAREL